MAIIVHTRVRSSGLASLCVCVAFQFILDVRLVDAPAGVTEEEGRTGFLLLPFANFSREKDSIVPIYNIRFFVRSTYESSHRLCTTISIK